MRFKVGDYLRVKKDKIVLFSKLRKADEIVLLVMDVNQTTYRTSCLVGDGCVLRSGYCAISSITNVEDIYESFNYTEACEEEIV
jgi:hypothetical protein